MVLIINKESNEAKQEWILALRSANLGGNRAVTSPTPGGGGTDTQQSDCYGSEKDCQCSIM